MFNKLLLILSLITLTLSTKSLAEISNLESTSVGKYTAGCVKNSVELPADGFGYQVIRTSRKRNYGHSKLVNLIEKLSTKVKSNYSAKLLISDISKKGGGPILDDHSSHQIGLDADILYLHKGNGNNKYLSFEERERIKPISLLNSSKTKINNSKWSWINGEILKESSHLEEVDRIFVNPAVKNHLCKTYGEQDWLRKLRPWWGHEGHFHIRLKCPKNSLKCVPGPKIPEGAGCGSDLDWWFSKEAYLERVKKLRSAPKTEKDIKLPKECLEGKT